jgi:hypothetical protein
VARAPTAAEVALAAIAYAVHAPAGGTQWQERRRRRQGRRERRRRARQRRRERPW